MLKSVRVPPAFEPPFAKAEQIVERQFADFRREPEKGALHIGDDRYVLVRAEGFYTGWLSAMEETFGPDVARQFIYNSAREIGRSDSRSFSERLGLVDGLDRLASGPVHFAQAGWALVEILDDSAPAVSDEYFLHYLHPNTFESEVLARRNQTVEACACLFSAGYSAGWCSAAFGLEVHGRELRCAAKGDPSCEFIMAPVGRLDEHEKRVRAGWKT
jgi:predicted hydrocarbon binding protein